MSATATGSWREIKAIEITRPCGCVELLTGRRAVESRAIKLAAKACYQCELKARQAARRVVEQSAGPSISIGDYS